MSGMRANNDNAVDRKHMSDPPSNTEKAPEDWVSGDDPMTGAQATYLKTLSEETGEPSAFDPGLSKAEASRRIDALKSRRDASDGRQ